MPRQDWLDTSDGPLSTFANDFSAKITATPTAFGLVAGDATSLATLVTAYNTALAAATDPVTRTRVTVAAKDTAKVALIADIRALAKRIQASPAVTPAQKTSLGLPIHSNTPSPSPAPTTEPLLNIVATGNYSHTLRVADILTPTKRAKPANVADLQIFAFPGENPPADMSLWTFKGVATKAEFVVNYAPTDAGKPVSLAGRWANRKGETGPFSDPVTGTIAA
ncbi:MAG TPA: hypothetical protein VFE58_11865 [Tepidisphaeraceae bacterium]|jgi:hypothetical protein|nr:hypothetical protein [Tepidisphaeraceae bacterium]